QRLAAETHPNRVDRCIQCYFLHLWPPLGKKTQERKWRHTEPYRTDVRMSRSLTGRCLPYMSRVVVLGAAGDTAAPREQLSLWLGARRDPLVDRRGLIKKVPGLHRTPAQN